jgi:hypothetical protein
MRRRRKKRDFLGQTVELGSPKLMSELSFHFPIHKFSPYVALFIENARWLLTYEHFRGNSYEDLVRRVDRLNTFIDCIRMGVKTKEFQAALDKYHRQPDDNYASLMVYINQLLDNHSKLLVIRLDLAYAKDCNNYYLNENELYEKYWQAKMDMDHLLNNTRSNKTIFEHKVGHAWKLEYARGTGFHYHMFFFYNGSMVREDVTIAKMIGEYWVNTITKGRGRYFNCNDKKDAYKYRGIGMLSNRDPRVSELITGLKLAATYLTKPDAYSSVKLNLPDDGHMFGKGEAKPKGTRGRPRINSEIDSSGTAIDQDRDNSNCRI